MRRGLFAAVLAASLVAGCVSTKAPQTASGRPEVTIPGASAQQVKAALANRVIDKGYRVLKDEGLSLTVEKEVENAAAVLLLSTGYGPPMARISFTVAELSGSVRVVADMGLVSNTGTAFERRIDVSKGADAASVQSMLDDVAAQTSGRKPRTARAG